MSVLDNPDMGIVRLFDNSERQFFDIDALYDDAERGREENKRAFVRRRPVLVMRDALVLLCRPTAGQQVIHLRVFTQSVDAGQRVVAHAADFYGVQPGMAGHA